MRIALTNVGFTIENVGVLHEITCSFKSGITYVVGKNGAGKSTLLKVIATATSPNQGTINYTKLIRDEKIGTHRLPLTVEEVRKVIGFMPQHFTGHAEMTVERYLTYMAFHKGIPHAQVKALLNAWLNDANLLKLKRKKLRNLSGGQLQKVGLIQALLNQPRICILDEPFEGLDTEEKLFFKRVIQRLSFHSIVIISTHLLEEINQSEDNSVLYMDEGELCLYGGVDELDEVVKKLTVLNEK
ncbi:ATP-binding cassette domain-containing protein [Sporosarcina sp. Marseille-Q4063]|uniref:ATP-binding cassette domain-containing protein n=1 Tax=Sporosarcina sp. Marseille-Q4063 TaxID=2810514 RepID=UPI001BB02A34|nr:ATP-binding cassette domain-containing protein [Sporosarcina sp. Marseille-Q4063]QUW20787.1 ATP-binding cassette domain-containing protein [Sporosarcina sp. Marseille-Q4063]